MSKLAPEALMTRDALARLLTRSRSMIPKYVLQGMPVHSGGGSGKQSQYLPSACVAWFVAQIEARFAGMEGLNPQRERALRDRAQARLAEQLHRTREGAMIEYREVAQALGFVVSATRSRLLAMPGALAMPLAATTEPAQAEAVLREAVRDALRDLSNWQPPEPARAMKDELSGDTKSRRNGKEPTP